MMARKGPSDDRDSGDGGVLEAASYVVEVTTNLAMIARRHRLDVLGYLLDMAQMEASEIVRLRNGQGHGQGDTDL